MVPARARVVAQRAAELSLASGVPLPEDLALWRLAGGRPHATAVAGRPEELGVLLEGGHDAPTRRRRGVHYTPHALAEGIARRAVEGHEAPSVCDPACGGGALLLAAARAQAAAGAEPGDVVRRLWGADVDPLAVATTEAALTLWAGAAPPPGQLVQADTLLDPPQWGPFDVVIGNPPFLSQLAAATARGGDDRRRLRGRFGAAVGAYTDTAALFLLAAVGLVRSGGRVAMVQPQSLLSARDAAGVRDALAERASLREVWVPPGRAFRAAVDTCVVLLDVDGRGAPVDWGGQLADSLSVPVARLRSDGCLGDEASVGAAFRTEYYGTSPHVQEADACPDGTPLLTTGLVDLAHAAWGERSARVGGRRWDRPVVDPEDLDGRAAAWARRCAAPKLLIATQTRVVEVVVDEHGRFLAGVPLVVAWAPLARLWALAAALASPPITAWAARSSAGTALSSGAIKLTAGLVRAAPLPADEEAWAAGAAALELGDLERFARTMTEAYGCDAEVADWWLGRVGSFWSPRAVVR